MSEVTTNTGLPGAKSEIKDPMFTNFQDIFCRFYEAQDTENARFYVLINVIH